jgi:hypothetical protein
VPDTGKKPVGITGEPFDQQRQEGESEKHGQSNSRKD